MRGQLEEMSMAEPFPGRSLKMGMPADPDQVRKVQEALISLGLLQGPSTCIYDLATEAAVRAFQARGSDAKHEPLAVDGIVGPITWAALMGGPAIKLAKSANQALANKVLEITQDEARAKVRETSPNRGPKVDQYVEFCGLNAAGGHDWCVCFLQWCFDKAAQAVGDVSPMPFRKGKLQEPGAQRLWRTAVRVGTPHLTRADAMREPGLLPPASVFVMDRGGGLGHVGMVVDWKDDRLVTVEGNTAPDTGGPSNGVHIRTNRRISQVSFGFILYC
jgi:hypothetical protein